MKLKNLCLLIALIALTGCATNVDGSKTFGMVESKAWFDFASRETIEKHFDSMEPHQLCIRWAETRSTQVRNEISNSLKRRGMNPLFCY